MKALIEGAFGTGRITHHVALGNSFGYGILVDDKTLSQAQVGSGYALIIVDSDKPGGKSIKPCQS